MENHIERDGACQGGASNIGFGRDFGKWLGGVTVYIFAFYVFIPLANFKLTGVIIKGFQNLDSTFTYYDLVTPIFVAYWIITFLVIFRRKKKTA